MEKAPKSGSTPTTLAEKNLGDDTEKSPRTGFSQCWLLRITIKYNKNKQDEIGGQSLFPSFQGYFGGEKFPSIKKIVILGIAQNRKFMGVCSSSPPRKTQLWFLHSHEFLEYPATILNLTSFPEPRTRKLVFLSFIAILSFIFVTLRFFRIKVMFYNQTHHFLSKKFKT